ncbi:MAG: hypothetical protein L0154_06640 [Chloroflexi bacterium]|nr:hypothetical protein [Chloroflexota bacterium]
MKRWGLRWIFCWLSVFITAACGQFSSPTPTRDNAERTPTLQNLLPPSTASPVPPIRPLQTITPPYSATAMRLATIDPSLLITIDSPACYETIVQSLVCLGWIQNQQDTPVTNTFITFYLLNPQGETLTVTTSHPVLSIIAPDNGTPYRVIFNEIPDVPYVPYAEIRYGETLDEPLPVVEILDLKTSWDETRHLVTGRVQTGANVSLEVVITIRNSDDKITGFRTIQLEQGEEEFSISVTPLDEREGTVEVGVEVIR